MAAANFRKAAEQQDWDDRIVVVRIATSNSADGETPLWSVAILDPIPHPVTGKRGHVLVPIDWTTLQHPDH